MSEKPCGKPPGVSSLKTPLILFAAVFLLTGCNSGLDLSETLDLQNLAGNPSTQTGQSGTLPVGFSPNGTNTIPAVSTSPPVLVQDTTQVVSRGGAQASDQACVNEAAPGRPIDVNIPDDTIMQPGQEFNKTWRLINAGTCTWDTSYQVVWYWGEQMSNTLAFPLEEETPPGKQTDVTASLIAPQKPGVYQSNWKLRGPTGQIFGVGPGDGLYFYVRIIVAGSPVPESDNRSLTVQNTPTPFAGGPTRLLPADRIDLDRNILNPTSGEDVAMTSGTPYFLVPFADTFFSFYGKTQPTENQCLSTAPSKTPLQVDTLEAGIYLCYLTDEGRSGWIRIQNFWTFQERALLNLEVYTWPLP